MEDPSFRETIAVATRSELAELELAQPFDSGAFIRKYRGAVLVDELSPEDLPELVREGIPADSLCVSFPQSGLAYIPGFHKLSEVSQQRAQELLLESIDLQWTVAKFVEREVCSGAALIGEDLADAQELQAELGAGWEIHTNGRRYFILDAAPLKESGEYQELYRSISQQMFRLGLACSVSVTPNLERK